MRLGTRRGFPRRRKPYGEEGTNPRRASVRVEREATPRSSPSSAAAAHVRVEESVRGDERGEEDEGG